jgi:hypothetical protein
VSIHQGKSVFIIAEIDAKTRFGTFAEARAVIYADHCAEKIGTDANSVSDAVRCAEGRAVARADACAVLRAEVRAELLQNKGTRIQNNPSVLLIVPIRFGLPSFRYNVKHLAGKFADNHCLDTVP